ncbi:MAG: hypothetical protein OK456_06870 [Thaumarchaeota archaeon]|nr:hypothetical protein [Nitrososphaerota archaeon]
MVRPKSSGIPKGVAINRGHQTGSFAFREVFTGFEEIDAVKSIFLDRTKEVLLDLKVDLKARQGYLHVDDESGHIVVSHEYLKTGDERFLYLDVVHELVHIRQFMEGKELFDSRYSYLDRPTEIEAYAAAAEEAKRIGMKRDEIVDYLRVEWVTEDEFQRLLSRMGI